MHKILFSRDVKGLGHPFAFASVRVAVTKALRAEGIQTPCLISVMFTDNEGIRKINQEFRDVDRATDVLSFPMNELIPGSFEAGSCETDQDTGRVLLGDIVISIPKCEEQGKEFNHGFRREVMYLSVHSVLHLLGYDHVDEGEMKKQMRSREKLIMGDK